jgi:hypothetical protein
MKTFRCLLAVLLLVAFGGGTALAAAQAGDIVAPTIETSTDQTMPGGCDHCAGNEKGMTTAACSAFGTCVHGVVSPANGFTARSESVRYSYSAEHISGLQGSPDPFPPRSDILA